MQVYIVPIVVVLAIIKLLIILVIVFKRKPKKAVIEENKKVPLTYWDNQNAWLVQEFSRCNVIVFGKKGSGKDVLFNHAINLRGLPHYSNMPYNHLTMVAGLDSLSVGENTYCDFINQTVQKFAPVLADYCDYYISDGGVFLPSQYDKELDKRYAGMPLFYALSRQLHKMNVHANVQALGRLWKKLREQADSYIWVQETIDCGEFLVVHVISYDRYESAERFLLPCEDKQYSLINGDIQYHKFKVYKRDLSFDTCYFRKVLLNADNFIVEKNTDKITLKEILNSGYKCNFK